MVSPKRFFFITAALVGMFILAGCGTNSPATATSTDTPVPTATSTTAPAPTATTASTGTAVVKTATATVAGTSETILTDAQGRTLYYFTPDTSTTAACTGGCTGTWPPLLFTGSGAPTASGTLPGTLSVKMTGNGAQVEYNGHPLYTFKSDQAPGDTKGEGVAGKWHVATPTLAQNT